ncbi:MAG: hypothetical protein OEZ39_05395 [Gammaproteobacteria bacterium]|nr:hypothetical protein [Gammaproteobacteria bacterium]
MNTSTNQNNKEQFRKPVLPLEVIAMEMISPSGANAIQSAAVVRAGISAYASSSIINTQHRPITMALVPDEALPPLEEKLAEIPGITARQKRMLKLATLPLQQLVKSYTGKIPLPLLLAVPEKLPGRRSVVDDNFLKLLQVQSKVKLDLTNSYLFPGGRAGSFEAIEGAMLMVEQGISPYVIVGAVDSYIDLTLLDSLSRHGRVLAEGCQDGFAPAEGAAFIVVKAATENSKNLLLPPGIAEEVGHRYSNEPYKGEGLAVAVTEALEHLKHGHIKTILAGFNGESFNSKEWGVSVIRNSEKLDPQHDLFHPADCFGDTGAALGLMLVQLGIIGLSKGYYKGPLMAWCSSELAPRGAICIAEA